MPFPLKAREEALVRSRRCCCVCREFAGLYTNVHHIQPEADGGPNTIENAIVLCLRCHGEAGHYNPRHPIGTKYSPAELQRHRDEWWEWCKQNSAAPLPKDVSAPTSAVESLAAELRELLSVCKVAAERYPFGATDAEIQISRVLPALASGGALLGAIGDASLRAMLIGLDRELKALPATLEYESRVDPNRTSVARGGYCRLVDLINEILAIIPSLPVV